VMGATGGVRGAGAAALDLVDVAAGRLDCFWELTLAPWDVAAGVVLVREAGGVVTTLDGSPDVLQHGSVVAGNPTLHKWLMDLLSRSLKRGTRFACPLPSSNACPTFRRAATPRPSRPSA